MKFKEYVVEVLKTESNDFPKIKERMSDKRMIRLNHGAMGIMTEVGELFEMLNKKKIDLTNLMEECSDVMWYIGVCVDELQIDKDKFIEKTLSKRKISLLEKIKFVFFKRNMIIKVLSNSTIHSINLLDFIKKGVFYGKEINFIKFEDRLSDVFSEMIFLLELSGYSYERAMDINIKKLLNKRFKSGKFSENSAINRDVAEERKTLEEKD